ASETSASHLNRLTPCSPPIVSALLHNSAYFAYSSTNQRIQATTGLIQQLQLKLRDHCSQSPAIENFRPAPGTVCCSLFSEDNQWYRAKVLGYSSEEKVCVGYIDFGNSEEVNLSQLRPINSELLALPTQAIPCALAGVYPTAEAWSAETVMMLRQMVCNRFLRVDILGEQEGMALVALIDEASDPQGNVADLLVAAGYALPVPHHAKNNATKSRAEGAMTQSSTVAKPAVAKNLQWTCAELPPEGETVSLVVTVIEHPGEFYCNKYNQKDTQILVELGAELKQHCEADMTPFIPIVGDPCCALFSGDGAWYRGMVQCVYADGKACVYFVDYGNTSKVEPANLRPITPDLLQHPFQAVRCWLTGVEPLVPQWGAECIGRFLSLCVGKLLHGHILSITEQGYGLELESSGQNVAATLLSETLVKATGKCHVQATPAPIEPESPQQKPIQPQRDIPTSMCPPEATVADNNDPPPERHVKANVREATVEQVPKVAIPADLGGTASPDTFPLAWKTVELSLTESFEPRIAAVVSPSLFYVLNPSQVAMERLQIVMMDLAVYCTTNTSPSHCKPIPGAACCAKFSGDKNWYRAIVLETTETEASVLYADYGNSEKIPFASIRPIPKELLQLPFQIARCALTGTEHFPSVWPFEVLEVFRAVLSDGVLASVQAFDGHTNLLSVSLPKGQGGGSLNALILEALQKTKACNVNTSVLREESDQIPVLTTVTTPADNQVAERNEAEMTDLNSPCCCREVLQKVDRLEQYVLVLLKQIGGSKWIDGESDS
ncbi:hypothetical protein UPYG_G00143090, partial [Umbra pygmaea]